MWKQILIFAIVLAGLVLWDQSLSRRAIEARDAGARIRPLISEKDRFDRAVAAFGVESAGGQRMLFLYADGMWRSVHAHGAPAVAREVESLLPALLDAEGVIRTSDPAAAPQFGFDTPEMMTLTVRGTDVLEREDGDVIYSLDLGNTSGTSGGSYVRPTGTNDIWAVNFNLRSILEPDPETGLPPMLDPHLIPEAWPGQRHGIRQVTIQEVGEPTVTLLRREVESGETGGPTFEWIVRAGSTEFPGHPMQMFSYMGFLMRAPFAGILNPSHQGTLGLETPNARITIEAMNGSQLQLLIGGSGPRGGVAAGNTFTRNLYELAPPIADLLTPEIEMMVNPELGNPWEDFIRR